MKKKDKQHVECFIKKVKTFCSKGMWLIKKIESGNNINEEEEELLKQLYTTLEA